MDNPQIDPTAIITGILGLLAIIWRFAGPLATRLATETGKRIIDESAKAAQGAITDGTAKLEAKLAEQAQASKFTFDMFLENAANMRIESKAMRLELDTMNARMADAQRKISCLPELETRVHSQEKQLAELQKERDEGTEANAKMRRELDTANATIKVLQMNLEAAQRDIQSLMKFLRDKGHDTSEIRATLETDHGGKTDPPPASST